MWTYKREGGVSPCHSSGCCPTSGSNGRWQIVGTRDELDPDIQNAGFQMQDVSVKQWDQVLVSIVSR